MRGVRNHFDDEGLDRLYRETPRGVERTQEEIAIAAGSDRRAIWWIEHNALRKIGLELQRRGLTPEILM